MNNYFNNHKTILFFYKLHCLIAKDNFVVKKKKILTLKIVNKKKKAGAIQY